jgi:hypothetical protein
MLNRRKALIGYVTFMIAHRVAKRVVRKKAAAVLPPERRKRTALVGGVAALAAAGAGGAALWRKRLCGRGDNHQS